MQRGGACYQYMGASQERGLVGWGLPLYLHSSQASAKGGVSSIRRRDRGPYNTLQSGDVGGTGWGGKDTIRVALRFSLCLDVYISSEAGGVVGVPAMAGLRQSVTKWINLFRVMVPLKVATTGHHVCLWIPPFLWRRFAVPDTALEGSKVILLVTLI
jgi:hypothetical protein